MMLTKEQLTLAIDSGKVETERFELFFIKSFTTGETPLKPMMNIDMWDGRMAGILLFWDECTIVRELRCGGNRRDHEDPLLIIQFFNRDEVESDVMEEEVM